MNSKWSKKKPGNLPGCPEKLTTYYFLLTLNPSITISIAVIVHTVKPI